MSRDYRYGHNAKTKGYQRRSQQASSKPQKIAVGKIWLVGALLSVNLLGGFLVVKHFMSVSDAPEEVAPSKIYAEVTQPLVEPNKTITVEALPVQPEPAERVQTQADEASSAPKYSFYQGLKESEVVVNAEPISVELDSAYYILAGTFGSEKVALNEQKRLDRLGQQVRLTQIEGKKRLYYRLSVGPFTDRLKMNAKRNELRRLGVDTLLIKAK